METKDIIIMVVCIAAAGFSIYRKYNAKKKSAAGPGTMSGGTSMPSGLDDDYEPYSGK